MDEPTRTGSADVHVAVERFLVALDDARHLPGSRIAALLRVADLDGEPAARIREAIDRGDLFGAGLRDLVGRHALRGADLALFVLRDVLQRPLAEAARSCGTDARTARRRLRSTRARIGLAESADPATVRQWLVTELIAPPARALQLQLFEHNRPEERVPPGESGIPPRELGVPPEEWMDRA